MMAEADGHLQVHMILILHRDAKLDHVQRMVAQRQMSEEFDASHSMMYSRDSMGTMSKPEPIGITDRLCLATT